jgi:hypothetical protein
MGGLRHASICSYLTESYSVSAMSISRPAFRGPHRKLVLAFDVGTTFSRISYRYATMQTEMGDTLVFNTLIVYLFPEMYRKSEQ